MELPGQVEQACESRVVRVGEPSQQDFFRWKPGHRYGDDMLSESVDGAVADDRDQLPGGHQVDQGVEAYWWELGGVNPFVEQACVGQCLSGREGVVDRNE